MASEYADEVHRVGIVGGGQLARMLGQAAIPLSIGCRVLTDAIDESTADLLPQQPVEPFDSWLGAVDVVTFEHELLPIETIRRIEASGVPVRPSADVMALSDKAHQRRTMQALGLPVPDFTVVTDRIAMEKFAADHGWPIVVKLTTGGYDGRGVWVVADAGGLDEIPVDGQRFVVEPCLALEREIAVQVARRPHGELVVYPVVETVQRDGMCREVIAPADIPTPLAEAARRLAADVAESVGLVGFLAIELFVVDGFLIINELAPRVHNSGHYSIEACATSQFENQLRAILDLPLGSPVLRVQHAVMVNVVGSAAGDPVERLAEALSIDGVHVHLYGKSWKPGRKLGHVTAVGNDVADLRRRAHAAVAALGGERMDQ